jgi:type IV pilus assembly protein PilA
MLDWVLACASQPCRKSGYDFTIIAVPGSPIVSYTLTAVPAAVGQTGVRGFCSDQITTVTADPAGGTACTMILQ